VLSEPQSEFRNFRKPTGVSGTGKGETFSKTSEDLPCTRSPSRKWADSRGGFCRKKFCSRSWPKRKHAVQRPADHVTLVCEPCAASHARPPAFAISFLDSCAASTSVKLAGKKQLHVACCHGRFVRKTKKNASPVIQLCERVQRQSTASQTVNAAASQL